MEEERREKEREKEKKKREGGERRTLVWRMRRIAGRGGEEGRQCPRSCVAQRETFNSVTPGLNYHAETIVPGKIKKGALARLGGVVVPSQNHAQSRYRDERGERSPVEEGRNEKDNDEISFSSAGPVVALGLT